MIIKLIIVFLILTSHLNLASIYNMEDTEITTSEVDDPSNDNDLKQAVEALASSSSMTTSFENSENEEKPIKASSTQKCQEITVPMCRNMEYNLTSMPNQFNHETQQEAAMEAHQFWALVEINCAKELRFFLCSMYTPICLPNYAQPIKACKSVCVRARLGCEKYMKKFGFSWPDHMNCDLFPEYGSSNQVCMDPMDAQFQTQQKNKKLNINHNLAPETVIKPSIKLNYEFIDSKPIEPLSTLDSVCIHPFVKHLTKPVSIGGLKNCMQPCTGLQYFNKQEKAFAHYWLLIWSMICFLSSLCTALTFLIQPNRFKYPERPIILLSLCYLFVSFGYLLKYIIGSDQLTCQIDQPRKSLECTLTFIFTYYFGMASSVWWVVISFTWFLAAGLKWGSEAIAKYHVYFHMCAWLLPFIQTISVLAFSYIDTDSLSGLCFVGNFSTRNLVIFLLVPSILYLTIGITFLTAGFFSLFKIRKLIKQKQHIVNSKEFVKTHKLEKLMIRIGIFSILYTVPATCVIACQFYEKLYRQEWEKNYLCRNAGYKTEFCSTVLPNTNKFSSEPEFLVFLLKYLMSLIVGVTSGFWIWTNKTCKVWKEFFSRILSRSSAISSTSSTSTNTTSLSDSLATQQNSSCFSFCFGSSSSQNKINTKTKDSIVYFQANDDLETNPHNFYENNNKLNQKNSPTHVLIDDNVIYHKHYSSTPMPQQLHYKGIIQQQNAKIYGNNGNSGNLLEPIMSSACYNSSNNSVATQSVYQSNNFHRQGGIYNEFNNNMQNIQMTDIYCNNTNTMSSKYSVPVSAEIFKE